jgi:hypothetical protein
LTIPFNTKFEIWPVVLLIPATLIAVSCTRSAASADAQRPPDVELVPVQQKDIPVYREWIGTVDGMVNAAIRAQVAGLSAHTKLLRRLVCEKRAIVV